MGSNQARRTWAEWREVDALTAELRAVLKACQASPRVPNMRSVLGICRLLTPAGGDIETIPHDRFVRRARALIKLASEAFKDPTVRKADRPLCGALTRKGQPCQAPAVWDREHNRPRNGRCRRHGGLSTGPRTEEGRARIAESNRRRAEARREAVGPDGIQEVPGC